MASRGQIRFRALKKHMDTLLPGWEIVEGSHWWTIPFDGETAYLPKGELGASNPELEVGHVKHLFRVLGKLEEARKQIPQLR